MTGADDPSRVGWWAVHPGGFEILRKLETALGLKPDALASSRNVLRALGNLSSPSVVFVLLEELERVPARTPGILLGFGPGLTLEALQATRGGRRAS